MARPRKTIDYDQLSSMCAIQCTGEECASVLGISYDTLVRALHRELGCGFADYFKKHSGAGRASLRRRQFEQAKNNPTMAIWLGKQYLGQADKQELTGAGGGPMQTMAMGVDQLKGLSDEELKTMHDLLKKATTGKE